MHHYCTFNAHLQQNINTDHISKLVNNIVLDFEYYYSPYSVNPFISSVSFGTLMGKPLTVFGKLYEIVNYTRLMIEYLETPVNFGKPRKCQFVIQNLAVKGLITLNSFDGILCFIFYIN